MKKKEKVKKEPSKFKKWHQKMKSTPKGRAYLKLIYWAIFFVILFIFLGISSSITRDYTPTNHDTQEEQTPEENKENTEVLPTILDMQEELLSATYEYTYDIKIDENSYLFEGNKYPAYEEGYKTSPTGTIRYYLDNTGIYQVMGDNRTLIHDFYLGIDTQYMDLAHVFDIMNILGLHEDTMCDCTYPVYFTQDEFNRYTLSLSEDARHITDVTVTSLDNRYEYMFSFRNLGGFDA